MDYKEYLTQALAKDDELLKEYEVLESEYKSIEDTLIKESNIQKIENFLEGYGIKVKTEYGNYRPICDVLEDISEHWEEWKKICEHWNNVKHSL